MRCPDAPVVRDAVVRAYVHLDTYDLHRPFYPWLSTIAVRLAQNWLVQRTRTGTREGTPLDATAEAATGGADPLADLIASESDRKLWTLVAGLPSGERTAVILYYRQEMSVHDIARAVDHEPAARTTRVATTRSVRDHVVWVAVLAGLAVVLSGSAYGWIVEGTGRDLMSLRIGPGGPSLVALAGPTGLLLGLGLLVFVAGLFAPLRKEASPEP